MNIQRMNPGMSISTLAAMVVLAVPAASRAQATSPATNFYGLIDVMARHASNAATGTGYTISDGAHTGSRLGFKGGVENADKIRTFFSLEFGIDPSTGTSQQSTTTAGTGQGVAASGRLAGREALVGVAAPLGSITLGRQYTLAHQYSGRFQPQANPNDPALSVLSVHHVARQDNMVKYSQAFGAFGVSAAVTASEKSGSAQALGGSYTSGSVDAVAYLQNMKTTGAETETRKIAGAGGSFAVTPELKLYLGGMTRRQEVSPQRNKVLTAGVNYTLTPTLALTAGYTDDNQTGASVGHRKVTFVGASYYVVKDSDLYIELDSNRITGAYAVPAFMKQAGTQTGLGMGVRYRF